jgi:sugar/nucleoside kinase (ribokinase family)
MSVLDDEHHVRLPAQAREVFDVAGEGDPVIAVVAALMACGLPLVDAANTPTARAASSSAASAPRASRMPSCSARTARTMAHPDAVAA